MLKNIYLLLRPHQWLKNVFCFLPLFFNGHMLDIEYLVPCLFVFLAYSFAASGIYCFNDIYDVEHDRLHPQKCKRPIASGAVSKLVAYMMVFLCWIVAFCVLVISPLSAIGSLWNIVGILTFYIVLNLLYCVRLKQIAIVDVFVISIGFVLRVLVGGIAVNIELSNWIVLMTFLLALFLAFAKRRDDVVIYEGTGIKSRNNIDRYNVTFMNEAIGIIASVTMVCYIMYTVSPEVEARFHTHYLYITAIFVLAGLIRYMQVSMVDLKSGSPTKVLLKDRFIQMCIMGWVATFFVIIYCDF